MWIWWQREVYLPTFRTVLHILSKSMDFRNHLRMNQDNEEETKKKKSNNKRSPGRKKQTSRSPCISGTRSPRGSARRDILCWRKPCAFREAVSPHIGGWSPGFITAALSRRVQLKAQPKLSYSRPQGCANIAA